MMGSWAMRWLLVCLVLAVADCGVVHRQAGSHRKQSVSVSSSEPRWVALFFDANTTKVLLANYLFPGPNARQPQGTHSTIEFNPTPNALAAYEKHFGVKQELRLLAFGMDEHDEALMVHTTGPVVSTNSFPHVTVGDAGKSPYTAVYSNTLWERCVNRSAVVVTERDEHGKPAEIALDGNRSEWEGALPVTPDGLAPTWARVQLLPSFLTVQGTFCVDDRWNATEAKCVGLEHDLNTT
eukprot:m.12069 g.12069  ORF g.12069 m.12069 type:complete len:238 (-) comp4173_c0_seq1:31-744(-)